MGKVENYFFMKPLLKLLGQRQFFYKLVVISLRVLASILILAGMASFFKAGKTLFDLPTKGAITGGILFLCFFVLATYAVVHILFLRARSVSKLQADEYFMLPLTAVLCRLIGELYFFYVSLMAIGGGLFVWFTSKSQTILLSPTPAFFPKLHQANFIGGIEYMLTAVLVSFLVLVASYAVAEALDLLVRKFRLSTAPHKVYEEPDNQSRFGS